MIYGDVIAVIPAKSFARMKREAPDIKEALDMKAENAKSKYAGKSLNELTLRQMEEKVTLRSENSEFARKAKRAALKLVKARGCGKEIGEDVFPVPVTVKDYILAERDVDMPLYMDKPLKISDKTPEGYMWVAGAKKSDINWELMQFRCYEMIEQIFNRLEKLYAVNKPTMKSGKHTMPEFLPEIGSRLIISSEGIYECTNYGNELLYRPTDTVDSFYDRVAPDISILNGVAVKDACKIGTNGHEVIKTIKYSDDEDVIVAVKLVD